MSSTSKYSARHGAQNAAKKALRYAVKDVSTSGAGRHVENLPDTAYKSVTLEDIASPGFKLAQAIDNTTVTLKRAVKAMRGIAGLHTKDLAKELNVSSAVISRLENLDDTRTPTVGMLLRVADVCGYELALAFRKKRGAEQVTPRVVVQADEDKNKWLAIRSDGITREDAAEAEAAEDVAEAAAAEDVAGDVKGSRVR